MYRRNPITYNDQHTNFTLCSCELHVPVSCMFLYHPLWLMLVHCKKLYIHFTTYSFTNVFIFHYRTNWIKLLTSQLKPGHGIILSVSDTQEPLFDIIKTILCDRHETLLCVTKCINITYQGHMKAWEIQESSETSVVKFKMQMTEQILHLTPAKYNTYYISLKHAL